MKQDNKVFKNVIEKKISGLLNIELKEMRYSNSPSMKSPIKTP